MNINTLYKLYTKNFLVDTDTRKIRKGTIFFALKGDNFNGNTFANEALNKGASHCIVDEKQFANGTTIHYVENVLTTLQKLAAYHRLQLKCPIIALTGSNGKTTTKELIDTVLKTKYKTTATIGNLNNHIGVPLTLLSMNTSTEIGIVEMGANHIKEIELLCSIATPDYGYITNFGKAHLEGFGSIEGVIKGKTELYQYLKKNYKTAFVNMNDPIQRDKTKGIKNIPIESENIQFIDANPFVKVQFNGNFIQSNLIGKYNYGNIAAAIEIGRYFGVSESDIKDAIENYASSNNRSQIIKKGTNTIILDAYNANPTSMLAALNSFQQVKADNKTVILGDMFELGDTSTTEHQKIVDATKLLNFTNSFFVGNLFATTDVATDVFTTFDAFEKHIKVYPPKNQYILIKGSRGMALERILKSIN